MPATANAVANWTPHTQATSKTDPSKSYRIDVNSQTGAFRCQCKGFIFSRTLPKDCKHIRAMKAQGAAAPLTHAPALTREQVALPMAQDWLSGLLAAGGMVQPLSGSLAHNRMAAFLAAKIAQYAPPAAIPVRSGEAPRAGLRHITFDDSE